MKYRFALVIACSFLLSNCQKLPKTRLYQYELEVDYNVVNDSLRIGINNSLNCQLRVFASCTDEELQEEIAKTTPITLLAKSDTLLFFPIRKTKEEIQLGISSTMGNPQDLIYKKEINLPFLKGNQYKIIQGYNGSYSHSYEHSKYAIDFNMKVGDTVCAAADGYVVGVIEGYSKGSGSKKWRDYANYITIFHPEMNLFTQYVHLTHNGSLVEL